MDVLFELISSLSQNEKRYFKVFAEKSSSGKDGQLYVKLFNTLEKMPVYDEKKIKDPGILKNLRYNKHYLYKLILKSLGLFHSDTSAGIETRQMLINAEVLYWKGLHRQALRILKTAKKKAYQYENYSLLPDILKWENKLIIASRDIKKTKDHLSKSDEERRWVLKVFKEDAELKNLSNQMSYLLITQNNPRTGEGVENYVSMIDKLLPVSENLSSFEAQYDYFDLKNKIYAITGDNDAILNQERFIQWMEKFPDVIRENPVKYVAAIHNLLIYLFRKGDYNQSFVYLNKLKSVTSKSTYIKARVFSTVSIYELMIYDLTGDYQAGLKILPEVKEGLKQYQNQFNAEDLFSLFFLLFKVYFLSSDFSNALFWMNKIIALKDSERRRDIKSAIEVCNLILHYEMENLELLEYLAMVLYKRLKPERNLFKTEIILIEFIKKKLSKRPSRSQLINDFKLLREELHLFTTDPYERNIFIYFDFIAWLDSKIHNKPLAIILQEKKANLA